MVWDEGLPTRLTTSALDMSAARSAGVVRELEPHTRIPIASAARASRAPAWRTAA